MTPDPTPTLAPEPSLPGPPPQALPPGHQRPTTSRRTPGTYYPGADFNALHHALVFTGHLGALPRVLALTLAFIGVLAVTALAQTLTPNGLLFGLILGLAVFADATLLAELPHRRISFGPFAPQLFELAALRGAVTLALIALATALTPWPSIANALWLAQLLAQAFGTACALRGFITEPSAIGLTHRIVTHPKLHAPLRVLLVGDLHIERRSVREDQLAHLLATVQPDVLVFTGDFLNLSNTHDPVAWAAVRQTLAEWHAPYGVYAVTGSPLVDPPDVAARLLDGLPIVWLRDQVALVGPPAGRIRIVGITCTHIPEDDGPTLSAVLAAAPGADLYTLLLYHSPDLAPAAAAAGVDLHLAGHTHGGQVRLPGFGALLTSSLHGKRFEMGAYTLGTGSLYVARGVGLEGLGAPRVRFLCPPEVVLWEFTPPPQAPQ